MKPLPAISFLFLLVLSVPVFSQNDTARTGTFQIGKCTTIIDGKIGDAYFSIDELLDNPEVKATCSDCKVKSFELVTSYNGVCRGYRSASNHFTPEMITLLKKLYGGSTIIIENVNVNYDDGHTGVIPGEIIILSRP